MRRILVDRSGYLRILAFLGLLSPIFHLQASDVVGQFFTANGATVSGQELAVTLSPRQEYMLFSGDRVHSSSGQGTSVLTVPEAGNINLAPDTAVGVERSQSEYLLDVEHGRVGFNLIPGAPVFLRVGEERIHLAEGTGKGGLSVTAEGGYLVLVDPQGDIRVTLLDTSEKSSTGEVIYQGAAKPELIYAQFAAPLSPQYGAATGGLALGGAMTAPLVAGLLTMVLALIDSDPSVFRQDERTRPPVSPVRPPGPPVRPPGPPVRPPGPPVSPVRP
jgi:hypothetical protein